MEDGMEIPAPVGSVHCLPEETQLIIKRDWFEWTGGRFTIKDGEGSLLFDVKGKDPLSWHYRRILLDESGQPVLLLKSKFPSLTMKWAAYRGDDETDAKLLFTVQMSAIFQLKPSFDVFLPTNATVETDSPKPDFSVEGNFRQTLYTVLYNGTPIATTKKISFTTKHVLTVQPGVDLAFIAALVTVVYSQPESNQ